MLQVYNSLNNRKETFTPLVPGKVGMYVCGVTVYDYCHIGHARVMVVFDVVARHLRHLGYELNYVRNITDIDDKIIKRAAENGEEWKALTERFVDAMHEDEMALSVQRPDSEPKATDNIQAILDMVQTLIDKDMAYVGGNGDVFYRVAKFDGYGKLSGRNIDELRAGERVAVEEAKEDPMDFVLWKKAKAGEPAWASPWGDGRPGWHIECSAMSTSELGKQFDIHGGGHDLQFPHHENEIAQSEAAHDCCYVNYWIHNGFVTVDDEKMSKSLHNFFTIREVLEKYPAEVIRYFILTSHYRSPLNYSDQHLDNAGQALERFYTALRGLELIEAKVDDEWQARFDEAMNDDFNTAGALAVMFDLVKEINKARETNISEAARLASVLKTLGGLLGILQDDPETFLHGGDIDAAAVEALIERRLLARTNKDWAEADIVRDELTAMGVVLEDTADGTIWRKA